MMVVVMMSTSLFILFVHVDGQRRGNGDLAVVIHINMEDLFIGVVSWRLFVEHVLLVTCLKPVVFSPLDVIAPEKSCCTPLI